MPKRKDQSSAVGPPALSIEEEEFRRWLVDVERRAILPLKWVLWLGSIFLWQYGRPGHLAWPDVDVFVVFFLYLLFILAEHYFFGFSKIPLQQVRAFCYSSYLVDLLYVTALIYLDFVHKTWVELESPDFYILYFLLAVRGFVLYRSAAERIVVNVLISLLLVLSFWLEEQSLAATFNRPHLIRIALVWMVILLSWFIFEIINRQKFELLKARERLYQSERLTALGEMAAGIAHEINNPIGIISAYGDYLLRQADATDPRREDYEVIRSEAQRCKKIVSELLRFARPGETRREPTNLCTLNDEVLRFIFHDKSDTAVRLEKTYAEDVPWVLADPVQVKQALLNVYVNAQQALAGETGEIRVTIAPTPRGEVQIAIADTGRGIAPKDLARVFDPFFTRKPGGSGLGLTITRRILEANHAVIELQPHQPRGVVVTVTFRDVVEVPPQSLDSLA
ncbi:MAG: ATP-binding protein [Candidatus Sumerlaeia bacterium]|nr:ATP-binding protein [Candidatus Sumerlaeia bacterium]